MLSAVEKVEALVQVPVFSGLDSRDLLLIAMICSEEDLPAGETLCEEGDEGNELYLLLKGSIHIFKDTPEGRREIARIEPYTAVGEDSLFTGNPRNASLILATDATILFLNRLHLQELILDYPQIALGILKSVLSRNVK